MLPTPDFAVGSILRRRYRLQSKIGRGGMATVFLARDEVLHRDVAVKVFQASATDQEDIAQQELEVRILASLAHHSVVTILDAGVDRTNPLEPHLFLVMELVGGSDLARRLEKGPLSPRRAAELGYDLAEGLEYIHHHGVVHRDIKPANVLLVDYGKEDSRPRAKLTDFGIARLTESAQVTDAGLTTGTAAYLSPEQARGNQIGPASDVYSLGLVLLECLTGELAFPGTPIQSAGARLVGNPVIPKNLSPAWRELLSAMTRRAPADRPPVRDVIMSLREIFITEVGRHRPVDRAIVPANESARMAAVRRYQLLDTPPDGAFDRITALAARVVKAPVAIVSVVDNDRIWFKSHHGLDIDEIGRDSGLCASAILHDGPWVVEGARTDPRTLLNPLVASDFGLQFYAGVPLKTHDGYNLGTLCVLDFEPRTITDDEIASLEDLAAMVMSELELRRESLRLHGAVTAP